MVDTIMLIIFLEQDRGLDALSRIIGRQKQIAVQIGNEVETQNGLFQYFISTTYMLVV